MAGFADGRTCHGFAYYSGWGYQMYDNSMFYNQQAVEAPGTSCAGTGSGAGLQVNSDWDSTTGLAKILNKPTI